MLLGLNMFDFLEITDFLVLTDPTLFRVSMLMPGVSTVCGVYASFILANAPVPDVGCEVWGVPSS